VNDGAVVRAEAAAPPAIELRRVTKVYGRGESEVRALDGIDLVVEPGEFVALMGASGSGKSTCLNILGCLDAPTDGAYLFRGVDVAKLGARDRALVRRHHFGFIFQGFHLLPRTTALENVELPLVYRGMSTRERRARARAALAKVGLADRETHIPSELSGGQQQRVAIARALVSEPSLILADEPTGNLDSQKTEEIVALLQELHGAGGVTIVMVTHEPDVAQSAERVITFRDGRILKDASSRASLPPEVRT
jgi:putative ABC transport system ATP-binding protein